MADVLPADPWVEQLPLVPWTVDSPVITQVSRRTGHYETYVYNVLTDWYRNARITARREVVAMKGEQLYVWATGMVRILSTHNPSRIVDLNDAWVDDC